ncbi:MAG: L-histidine N(alpha)-methyltransferase, partial [Chloroflexota bacterium]
MFKRIELIDFQPNTSGLKEEVIQGLQSQQKILPAKLFYDENGSVLFDQITALPEYYPTRTEQKIMDENIAEMASRIGERCLLIEYGSGSSQKTRTLLANLPNMAGFVPIDISGTHLLKSAYAIAAQFPNLDIVPICADYETDFKMPTFTVVNQKVAYFPGSTIGNFHPQEAVNFLKQMRRVCGNDSHLLIGVDLKKEPEVLHAAYNDSAGVTAEFNLNMLRHLNRELGANFNLDGFVHQAHYDAEYGRIEMHLISK